MRSVLIRCVLAAGLAALTTTTPAEVDLEFRAITPVTDPGDTALVGLYAVEPPGSDAPTLGAFEAILSWDSDYISLLGVDPSNPANLIFSGFPVIGSNGLNESDPPADGDGLLIGLGPLGQPIVATPAGTLIAVLQFEALYGTADAAVDLLATGGTPTRDTVVFDGEIPNTIVTGTLTGTTLAITCGPFDTAPPFGLLDLSDVNVFTTAFVSADPVADMNDDGIFDLVDINQFVLGFLAGCAVPPPSP